MPSPLAEGSQAPDFSMPADGGKTVSLADFKGKTLVLYFYPKDDTSGCTKEAQAFEESRKAFQKAGAVIVGVSKDPVKSHDRFKEKYGLTFTLGSDDSGVAEKYGVWIEKSMYGRKYMGIDRSTFIIDGKGKIRHIWRKVKVPGHAAEVLEAVKAL